MKIARRIAVLATVMVSVFAVSVTAYAASPAGYHHQSCAVSGCAFVDADGNGYCDNWGTNCAYVDADGDGICDNRPMSCTGYQDLDGDGICDVCGRINGEAGWCHGTPKSYGHHGRGHHGHGC